MQMDMRTSFPGYYALTPHQKGGLSRSATFTLDTNVLLNIYSLGPEARSAFLGILRRLSDQGRLWLTHQAALEFQQRRPGKILEQLSPSRQVKEALKKAHSAIKQELSPFADHPFIDRKRIVARIERFTTEVADELTLQEEEFKKRLGGDEVRDAIDSLFVESVGPPYTAEELQAVYIEGRDRYKASIPPGFGDSRGHDGKKDEPECYGDLVLWKQILDYAQQTRRSVVLVTEDHRKGDWYWRVNAQDRDSESLGPHPKLVEEMLRLTGKRFYVARTAWFSAWMARYLGRPISPQVIEEIAKGSGPAWHDVLRAVGEHVLSTQRAIAALGSYPASATALAIEQLGRSGVWQTAQRQRQAAVEGVSSLASTYAEAVATQFVQQLREKGIDRALADLQESALMGLGILPEVRASERYGDAATPDGPGASPAGQ
jgi:hypothetical protein